MSSNVPLLIELHEQTFVNEKEKVWSGALMVDICHIESIEQVKPTSIFMSSEDEEKWRKKCAAAKSAELAARLQNTIFRL